MSFARFSGKLVLARRSLAAPLITPEQQLREIMRTHVSRLFALGALACLPLTALAGQPPKIKLPVVPVEVTNADPIPVTLVGASDSTGEGSREIFSKFILVGLGNRTGNCNGTDLIEVPAGKRLVIENISATTALPLGNVLLLVGLAGSAAINYSLVVPAAASVSGPGSTFGSAGQTVHFYADSALRACVTTTLPTTAGVSVLVSGYYIDKP